MSMRHTPAGTGLPERFGRNLPEAIV